MEILDNLINGGTDFFKFIGFAVFVCFMIYLVCKTISFNYKFVEGMVNDEKKLEVATILKNGGDGGRVGLDHDKILERLETNRELLNKLLQLPQDTGKIREQLEQFKENIVLEELLLLNEASCKDCAKNKLVSIGQQLHAYKNIGDAIERIPLDKSSGWL